MHPMNDANSLLAIRRGPSRINAVTVRLMQSCPDVTAASFSQSSKAKKDLIVVGHCT